MKSPSHIQVKTIKAGDTIPIRQAVLRAGKPAEACTFSLDNEPETIHLGLFTQDQLIGVVSLMNHQPLEEALRSTKKPVYQLRGMAIAVDHQGKSWGNLLLTSAEKHAQIKNCTTIWMNAREKAVSFYHRNGYNFIGDYFLIPEVGKHIKMYKNL